MQVPRRLGGRTAIAALAAAAAAAGVAGAAIPGSGGELTGCHQKANGQLRLIDPEAGDACRPSEAQVSWSQQGPKGDPGPAGPGRRSYAGYLQPRPNTQTITVGWQSTDPAPSAIEYLAPGRYRVEFSRADGLGCAVPTAMPFAGDPGATFTARFLWCDAQRTFFVIRSSTDQDEQVLLNVGFTR